MANRGAPSAAWQGPEKDSHTAAHPLISGSSVFKLPEPALADVMVRVFILKRLYNLSGEQVECQLLDRMSLQRFRDLSDSANGPDYNTIWQFAHPFAHIAQMGGKLIRTIGQARATVAITLMAACYNIKRLAMFIETGMDAFYKSKASKSEKSLKAAMA